MPIDKTIIDRTLNSSLGESAYKVCEKLLDAGFEAWWVGGSTRDMLLGTIPGEIDICTSALPKDVAKLFPKSDESAAHLGAIVVSQAGHTFEVTTFRVDNDATDGRHPESVTFGTREKDAARRDITIGCMYWNPVSRELFDPYKGEKDLKEGLIRFIGEAEKRLQQDALRILRAVRMRATINGQYEPKTYKALQTLPELIDVLSGTRIFQELEKMLLCAHPGRALEDLWELRIMERMIPELHACKGVAQPKDYHKEGDVWEHLMQCISAFTDDHAIDVRLATLFHDIGKTVTFGHDDKRIRFDHHAEASAAITAAVFKRLQVAKRRSDKICWMIEHHMMMGSFKDMPDSRKTHWYYHPWFTELLQLMDLDVKGTTPQRFELYDDIIADYDTFLNAHPRPQKPLLSGEEVMKILGLKPGEKVGELLQQLHEAQISKKVTSKKEAMELLESLK